MIEGGGEELNEGDVDVRVLTADWLPKTYLLNQAAILALGFWAIVNRGSVLQVDLVSARDL